MIAKQCLIGLLCVHAMMLAYGGWIHGPGWDEGGHLPAGISHWQLGNMDAYRVNPPLVRMVATAPIAWRDFGLHFIWSADTMSRPEWQLGTQFWKTQGREAYWYLAIARWASIPWSLLAAVVIFRWSRRLYGEWAGLFSAALWCYSPLVLANAQMMTPDTGASALGVAASFAFWTWLRGDASHSWSRVLDAGVLLGLAELSKFTWVILFVIWPMIWLLDATIRRWWLASRSDRHSLGAQAPVWKRGLQLIAILTTAIWIVNVGYGFEGTFTRLGEFRFASKSLRGEPVLREQIGSEIEKRSTSPDSQNRFIGTWLGHVPVPFPSNYLLGIDRQKVDFESDFSSYLRGQWRQTGWWYYYAYGLLVKEPIGYLLLLSITIAISLSKRWRGEEIYLLLPAIVVFGLVSSQTGFNHHLRYVLPAFPFVAIWMGKLVPWASASRRRSWVLAGLMGTACTASLVVFPHSHAYFNVIAGGPRHGHDHLLDSNIDWGQDILLLADWVQENPGKSIDGIAYSLDWLIDRESIGLPMRKPPLGLVGEDREQIELSNFGPQAGRYAVFVRDLRESDGHFEYFRYFEPVATLGYTVYLYEITPEEVDEYWRSRRINSAETLTARESH